MEILSGDKTRDWTLVLRAMDIPYSVISSNDEKKILVEDLYAYEATKQINLYEKENFEKRITFLEPHIQTDINYTLIICFALMMFQIIIETTGKNSWSEMGSASAEKILNGEWWRITTALFVHADMVHLFSNLLLLGITAHSVNGLIGVGLSWLSILLSGISGNLINAYIYGTSHDAIGSSTAVFGAVGLLGALQVIMKFPVDRWRVILPAGGALALLGLLGTGEENVDVLAHFFGFISGSILGLFCGLLLKSYGKPNRFFQMLATACGIFIIIFSWFKAAKF